MRIMDAHWQRPCTGIATPMPLVLTPDCGSKHLAEGVQAKIGVRMEASFPSRVPDCALIHPATCLLSSPALPLWRILHLL